MGWVWVGGGRYRDSFDKLRELKKEIEHLHMILEKSRIKLQEDFEQWCPGGLPNPIGTQYNPSCISLLDASDVSH